MELLTRTQFREAVADREHGRCAVNVCSANGVDAHHIIERRLFPDGGYYLDNGAWVCESHHRLAESTVLSAQQLREYCGISQVILPPHFYPDTNYDKWGNILLPNGRRLPGELFYDESVQKALQPVLHLFDDRVKYPRTWHLPWSGHVNPDDRVLDAAVVDTWRNTEVIITEKMDGENTTLYTDYLHARSIDYSAHHSRSRVRQLQALIGYDIPKGMRICGENLQCKHSIHYTNLASLFMVFSVWDRHRCLRWDETVEWASLLGLTLVPVLYRGLFRDILDSSGVPNIRINTDTQEGYVIRPADTFTLREFTTKVGKFVRPNHVRTHGHWMHSNFEENTTC